MAEVHLVRLILDHRELLRVAVRHRLGGSADDGALLHAGLSVMFATSTARATVPLHTYAVDDFRMAAANGRDELCLLAYSSFDEHALLSRMGPGAGRLLRECKTRSMPAFEIGDRLGFRARVCPVVRTRRPGSRPLNADAEGRVISREVDAFVHATLASDAQVDRERVYVQWIQRELGRDDASSFIARFAPVGALAIQDPTARLEEFRREQVRRSSGGRLERPNAVMQGVLTVRAADAFRQLLVRGLGRHRAFGFGMLLLTPAGRQAEG